VSEGDLGAAGICQLGGREQSVLAAAEKHSKSIHRVSAPFKRPQTGIADRPAAGIQKRVLVG